MSETPTIPEVVAKILSNSRYWAPEVRGAKLCDYLEAYGEPLYEALLALAPEERADLGVDRIRRAGEPS